MKTVDLSREPVTIEGILKLASEGSVRILGVDGHAYVIEDAGDFDQEVELLSQSEKFRSFLNERSSEAVTTTLDDYRRTID